MKPQSLAEGPLGHWGGRRKIEEPRSPALTAPTTQTSAPTRSKDHTQNDPCISFIQDVSTTANSTTTEIPSPGHFPDNLDFESPLQKSKKKGNKIVGFFKKIFKKNGNKKKKVKKKKVDIEMALSSPVTSGAGTGYSRAKVDFSKDEIFSNE